MLQDKLTVFEGIDRKKLNEILNAISGIKVALVGDISLDMYWRADMKKSELSRETPHYPLPVVEEWVSPGAGGNTASNIAALGPAKTLILSVVGNDWRSKELIPELTNRGIDINGLVISNNIVTNAYCKPLRRGISSLEYEDPRIDFANYNMLPPKEEKELLKFLEQVAAHIDVLCVCDQFAYGCVTQQVRERIIELSRKGLKVVVDSRDRIAVYREVILKPNAVEGYRAIYGHDVSVSNSLEEQIKAAEVLSIQNSSKTCMTLGAKGCVYVDEENVVYIPSYEVKPPLDTCGAGDTFLAAFSCALAVGATGAQAASFANIAADVTVKKLGMPGTASPKEIKARHAEIFVQGGN